MVKTSNLHSSMFKVSLFHTEITRDIGNFRSLFKPVEIRKGPSLFPGKLPIVSVML